MIIKLKLQVLFKFRYESESFHLELVSASNTIYLVHVGWDFSIL